MLCVVVVVVMCSASQQAVLAKLGEFIFGCHWDIT